MVHPVPAPRPYPPSTNAEPTSRMNAGTMSQKLMLFMRGNAMSGAPIMIGTNQLPNPPINAGMMRKNTMISPCAVTNTLNWCGSSAKYCIPGAASSRRIMMENSSPTSPAMAAKMR